MKLDKIKVEQWVSKFQPTCQVCGGKQWDVDDAGASFKHPNDNNLQKFIVPLSCHNCGNMIILDKNFSIQ